MAIGETPEQRIERCGQAGEIAVFDDKPTFRAERLRELLCRTPPLPCGVRIRGARIDGALDLTDCAFGALVLEDCDISAPIDMTGAHARRVSLRGSRFSGLILWGAKIDGMVDLSFASPLADVAYVDGRNVRVLGGMVGESVQLRSPPARPAEEVLPWGHNWALDLTEAHIECGCLFYGHAVIDGGVSLDCVYVRGTLSFRGAHVIAREADPFHPADSIRGPIMEVTGDVHLNFGFQSEGKIFLLGARIGNRLSISGKLAGAAQGYDWNGRPSPHTTGALHMDYLHTGAGFLLFDSEVRGEVGFNNATISKNVDFSGTRFLRSLAGDTSAVLANGATVGTDFSFGKGHHGAASEGTIALRNTKIGGRLDLTGFGDAAVELDLDLTGLTSAGVIMPADAGSPRARDSRIGMAENAGGPITS